MIASLFNKALANTISAPDGTWTQVIQNENDTSVAGQDHTAAIFWKLASAGDSGASFTFSKASDDNVVFGGFIAVWRGVNTSTPIDATAPTVFERTTSNDNVDFLDLDPTSTAVEVVLVAFHADDAVDFSTPPTGTNPTLTFRAEEETNIGTDCAIAICSGSNNGAATGNRAWPSNSAANAASSGVMFALVAAGGSPPPARRRTVIISRL
jgi:hypothetical protein